MPFRELSHTGDLRYSVTGATREEVFAESVKALFSTITDRATVDMKEVAGRWEATFTLDL